MLISIIVPTYNTVTNCCDSKFLISNILSLKNQTYKNIEIIYVNNNSQDETIEIISKYGKDDKRIKIVNEERQGVSFARNRGISEASGEYITFVDSDDYVSLSYIEDAVKEIKKYQKLDILIGDFIVQDFKNLNLFNSLRKQAQIKFGNIIKNIFPAIECPHNIFFSNHYLRDSKILYDKNILIGEDNLFNARAILNSENVKFYNSYFYYYNVFPSSSSNILSDKYITFIDAYDKISELAVEKYGYLTKSIVWCINKKFLFFYNLSINKKAYLHRYSKYCEKYKIRKHFKYYKLLLKNLIATI